MAQRSTQAPPVPTTQNTASVYEYRCLWTHDLKRKAKRWHDGYLKYHTFNQRIMVYDEGWNYIGDQHGSRGGGDSGDGLDEGDEVLLERGGAIVQVQERITKAETDLSELLAKRVVKPVQHEENFVKLPSKESNTRQLSRKQPTQATGRAKLTVLSPFEQRRLAAQEVGPRPLKRRRIDGEDDHVPLKEILNRNRTQLVSTYIEVTPPKPRAPIRDNGVSPAGHFKGHAHQRQRRDKQPLIGHETNLHEPNASGGAQRYIHLSNAQKSDEACLQQNRPIEKCDMEPLAIMSTMTIPSSPPVSATNHLPTLSSLEYPAPKSVEEQINNDRPKNSLKLSSRNSRRKRLLCHEVPTSIPLNNSKSHTVQPFSPDIQYENVPPADHNSVCPVHTPPKNRPAKTRDKGLKPSAPQAISKRSDTHLPSRPPKSATQPEEMLTPGQDDSPSVDDKQGPWTIEAFDLLGWYPPHRPRSQNSLTLIGKENEGKGWGKYEVSTLETSFS